MPAKKIIPLNNKMDDIVFMKYDECLNIDNDTYIAKDVNETGAKMYAPVSFSNLEEIVKVDQNIYEIIKEDRPRKFYIDYDCKFVDIKDWVFKLWDDIDENKIKAHIVDIIEEVMEGFLLHYKIYPISGEEFKFNVLDASVNLKKFSFHIVCEDVALKDQRDSKKFHQKFLDFVDRYFAEQSGDNYGNLNEFFDRGVYTKNRNMRCVGQSKIGQNRPLKIYRGSEDVKDHFITCVEKNKTFFEIPLSWIVKKPIKNKVKCLDKDAFSQDEELLNLIEHTLHKTINYEDWIKWIWACVGAGVPATKIHYYSLEACPDKYNEAACDGIIDGYDPRKGIGRGSLVHWAREKGYEVERHTLYKPPSMEKKRKDQMDFDDLSRKWEDKSVWDNKTDMIYGIRDDVNKVVNYIKSSQQLFVMYDNTDNPFAVTNKLPYFRLRYFADSKKEKVNEITLQKIMETESRFFASWNKIVFKPLGKNLRIKELNTWAGFEAEGTSNVNMELVVPILNHIKDVLVGGDDKSFKYVMTWLAHIIKTPYKKTEIFLLFAGKQGDGKGTFFDFLVEKVIGRTLSHTTTGLDSIAGDFNLSLKSKILVVFNELSSNSDGGGNWHSKFDKMKSYITDPFISIRQMKTDYYNIDNFGNFVGLTNYPDAVKLEKYDRRYACFSTSDCRNKDYEYFGRLREVMEVAGDDFYQYLLDYPQDEMVELRTIPSTKLRRDLIYSSLDSIGKFIDYLKEDKPPRLFDVNEDEMVVSNKHLYTLFCSWCIENGEKVKSNVWFGRGMERVTECVGRKKTDGKTVRWRKLKFD